MRILVSGAAGFVGRTLVPTLQARGHEVVPLRRGEGGVPADLAEIGAWTGWPTGIDAVVHLAALNPQRGERAADDDAALMRANGAGTKALAARAAREGVGCFVFASTNLVHAPSTAPVDEDARLAPQNAYAASKRAGEEGLRQALAGTPTHAVVLRLPPVYGPGGRGGLAMVLKLARSPLPLPFARSSARRSLLSVANAADALAIAVEHETLAGTFLVADGPPWRIGDLVAYVRQLKGRSPRLVGAPLPLLRAAAGALGQRATFDRLFADFVMDDRRFRAATGWHPPQSVETALRETVRTP
ncbi:NAD-dependent epimerase/dehydratase family protein [Aureimonas pseudogalii]|uniref:UDP-glucose 4-epimerase n=1 Tax=Aureimonas pseudogalii TaxID=1744844 RepID=A0A7W6EB02_9HYPH|nr:NAD-dependent epimerase/dehydratase family protein [Aureimonas pseudogalii]MBB3998002.1 UDP-glucose 4-epimerase [Aureimonas pseudogalii]